MSFTGETEGTVNKALHGKCRSRARRRLTEDAWSMLEFSIPEPVNENEGEMEEVPDEDNADDQDDGGKPSIELILAAMEKASLTGPPSHVPQFTPKKVRGRGPNGVEEDAVVDTAAEVTLVSDRMMDTVPGEISVLEHVIMKTAGRDLRMKVWHHRINSKANGATLGFYRLVLLLR
ncbi:hypothetical protein MAR_003865 [Mya arenaria]|uniref:Uncharacterized protein n=1 Tax=Mya arenaria TaxID=6604 RepID=A0ABY7EUY1_MYAAR|nr:hypothetical protein MAR_003865 [Mya arenaria]